MRQHLPQYLAGRDVERCQQDMGTVPLVLVFVSNGAVVAGDVSWVAPFEGLHRLLVDADHYCVLRRVEIKVADRLRLGQEVWIFAVQPLGNMVRADLFETKDATDLARAEAVSRLGRQDIRQRTVRPHVPESHDFVIRPLACQPHQLTPNRQRHRRRPAAAGGIFQRRQRRGAFEPSLPLSDRAPSPAYGSGDLLGPAPVMRIQHDPGALDDQVDVAPSPHQLFELAKQVAVDTETTRDWATWHTLSIDLASRLFPETRIGLRACCTSARLAATNLRPDLREHSPATAYGAPSYPAPPG